MDEKKYDDRSFKINQPSKEYKLSELTEWEREIYFAGVNEGMNDGAKFVLIFIAAVAAIVFIGYLFTLYI